MKIVRLLVKIILYILSLVIICIAILLISIQLPYVQNFAKDKLVSFLEREIHTEVRLDKIEIGIPNKIYLENLYIEDQKKDTLLYAQSFDLGLNMISLLKSKADITSIAITDLKANVEKSDTGKFNFDYIIDAFASDEESAESESKPFIISLDKIDLKTINVTYKDLKSKNSLKFYFDELDTRVKTFDLQENSYGINYVKLKGLRFFMNQDVVEYVIDEAVGKVDSLVNSKPMQLDLGIIQLEDISISYDDRISKTLLDAKFDFLKVQPRIIDLSKNKFEIETIEWSNADVLAQLFLQDDKAKEKNSGNSKDVIESNPLTFTIDQIKLSNINAHYQNTAKSQQIFDYLNFNNIKLSNTAVDVENVSYSSEEILANVKHVSTEEQSGLKINELRGNVKYGANETFVEKLFLETPNTLIRDGLHLKYNSLDDLTNNLNAVDVKLNLDRSYIAFKDLYKLSPELKKTSPFNSFPNSVLHIHSTVRGNLKKLYIDHIDLRGIDQTSIKASGYVTNVMEPSKLGFDLNIKELKSNASTIAKLLPPNTLPSSINLPEKFSIAGTLKGDLNILNANLGLVSSIGNAKINAKFDQRQKNNERYDIVANLSKFDVGQLIKNDQLSKISADIKIKGTSLDPEKANAVVSGKIHDADFNSYVYKDINLNGSIDKGKFDIDLLSNDPNAVVNLKATGLYTSDNLAVALKGRIEKVNLKELKFSESTMSFAGDVDADFTNLDLDELNGQLFLENFAISDGTEIYPIQDLKLFAISENDTNILQLNSQILDLQLIGNYKLTQISESLLQTINSYYKFTESKDLNKIKLDSGQFFNLVGVVKNDDLIRKFVPDLTYFENINLVGNYDADLRKITLNANVPLVEYGENKVENVLINIENNEQDLSVIANVGGFNTSSFALNEVNLGAKVADNQIDFDLSVLDFDRELQYYIGGLLDAQSEEKRLVLKPDGFKLNYEDWTVAPDNYLALATNGLYAHNVLLDHNGSQIFLDSEEDSGDSPLNVAIKDFQIETLTRIIQSDSLLASGVINGTAQIKDLQKQMSFKADVLASDLKFLGNTVGNLSLKANNAVTDRIDIIAALSEFSNDVKVNGFYNTKLGAFDFDVDVNSLQMSSLQGFSMNQIKEGKGFLSGNLSVKGTVSDPDILGKLKFNDVGMKITQLNSVFQSMNDTIDFRNNGIYFNQFNINDAENHSLIIDGSILTDTYRDFRFGLNLKGDDFKIVNSSEENSELLYGVMAIDVNLNIRGDLNLPKVDGSVEVTDQTDFTFILPQSSPALQERDGIIEFIDQDQTALLDTLEEENQLNETIKGLDVNVNISVDKDAKLSIVIDKANGDFVKLQGEAELTGGIDPSGKMTLLGNYEVQKGAYEMSVNVLKRKFDIQEGSRITWTGEPTKADVNITAVYETKAAPLDLVQQHLEDREIEYVNMFKQRIPFYANLKMKGELLKPIITFDITIDKSNPSVDTEVINTVEGKLKELQTSESELNKQVFALLLLNRFIGENPFQSSTGMSAEGIARQSVSKLLSQQLNNLASELIEGIELNFDLESSEDYSTGEKTARTDLNVGVSKRLLDDRLKVSIGSNFGLEGQERQNENMTNIAGDINIEYKLSKDGRYLLRAYRKDEYQVALQGQIIETGVGFIITVEYNVFKELLKRRRSNKEFKKTEKANRRIEEKQPIIKEDEE